MKELVSWLPLLGIALIFWLVLVRPAQRRQKDVKSMQSQVSVGDEVMLTSGIFGTVRAVEDDELRVEVSEGVSLRVARGAIGRVVPAPHDDQSGVVRDLDEES